MQKKHTNLYIENQLCFPLYAASRLTTKIYAPFLSELDITYPQYLVLMVLWQRDDQTVNEIGSRLLLESNTLTPLLKRMEQKKLATRKRSDSDERSVIVSLTGKSKELKNKASLIPDKIIHSFSDKTISASEIIAFQKTLFKLMKVLDKRAHADQQEA
jgi:DNA-binding MarR family transcriptional regulator